MNKLISYFQFLAWLIFRSQGLITYYIVDNYYLNLANYWIIYFIIASSFIYLSEKKQRPLIKKIWKK